MKHVGHLHLRPSLRSCRRLRRKPTSGAVNCHGIYYTSFADPVEHNNMVLKTICLRSATKPVRRKESLAGTSLIMPESNPGVFRRLNYSEVLLAAVRNRLWSTIAIHVITMAPLGLLSRSGKGWFLMHDSPVWPGSYCHSFRLVSRPSSTCFQPQGAWATCTHSPTPIPGVVLVQWLADPKSRHQPWICASVEDPDRPC